MTGVPSPSAPSVPVPPRPFRAACGLGPAPVQSAFAGSQWAHTSCASMSGVSGPPSPVDSLQSSPAGLQSQMLRGRLLPAPDPRAGQRTWDSGCCERISVALSSSVWVSAPPAAGVGFVCSVEVPLPPVTVAAALSLEVECVSVGSSPPAAGCLRLAVSGAFVSGGEPGPLLLCGRVSSQLTLQYLPGAGPRGQGDAGRASGHDARRPPRPVNLAWRASQSALKVAP